MQAARNAAASAKEMAANTAASAKAGLDKAKATVQEKVEKMRADDPIQKDMATHKKEERIHQAESNKQEVHDHNAAAHHVAADHGNQNSTIVPGHVAGTGHGNKHMATTGGTGPNAGGQGGFTTLDYLTGSDVPGSGGHNPGHNTTVEYPLTGPNTQTGLNPAREPGNADAVYPADNGLGGGQWQDPARNAHGGGPTSGFGTGGLIN